MTLEGWLKVATADLPPEVVARVRTESAGHVQDAVEAGEPEALAVRALGDPERVHRELHRLYLNDARLRALREKPARFLSVITWGLPLMYVLTAVVAGVLSPPFDVWRLMAPGLTLLLLSLLRWLIRHLPGERQALWNTTGAMGGIQLLQLLSWMIEGWYSQPVAWPWLIPLIATMLLMMLCSTLSEDLRLRRTLRLGSPTGRGSTGTRG